MRADGTAGYGRVRNHDAEEKRFWLADLRGEDGKEPRIPFYY